MDTRYLFGACVRGDLNEVKAIVERGEVDINCTSRYSGTTPLHLAMDSNHPSIVSLLLAQDTVKIDVCNKYNETPLHGACATGALDCVKLYTQHARITSQVLNIKDKVGNTALMYAVALGHTDVVKHLATVPGVDWNTKDDEGKTALEVAIDEKHAAIEDFLVKRNKSSKAVANLAVTREEVVGIKLSKSQKKRRNKKLHNRENMVEGQSLFNNNLMEAVGNKEENEEKKHKVSFGYCAEYSKKADGFMGKAGNELDVELPSSDNDEDELEKKLYELILHRKTVKQPIQAMSANLQEITEKLRNMKIEKENNRKDIEEVDADIEAQLKLLKLEKENLLAKEKSIDMNIIKLEAEKESVKSYLEKETAAFDLMETKLSTGLNKLEQEMKSVDGKTKDPKDCSAAVPGPRE